jgi:chemotaxis protein MotB
MSPSRKKTESDESPGAPEWMVTFSDCMTLLLTFFVLLLSFSSFDNKLFRKMERALAEGLPSVGISITRDRETFLSISPIKYEEERDKGSEKSTLDGQVESNPKDSVDLLELQNHKVFLIQSDKIFWGRGAEISLTGRQILSDLAVFLKTAPNRVVISENGSDPHEGDKTSLNTGLERSWSAMEYLTAKQGLDKMQFSISAASMVPARRSLTSDAGVMPERMLEIVLLERSVYH